MSEEDFIKSIDEYFNLDKVEEGEAFKKGYFSAMYRIKNIWKQLEDKIKKRDKVLDKIKEYLEEDDWTSVNGVIAVKLIKEKLNELLEEIK